MESVISFPLSKVGPANLAAVLQLLRSSLGETETKKRTPAFWRWKHEQNPFGPSLAICATDDRTDLVVGLRALMRWNLMDSAGRQLLVARAVDTATLAPYRRRGIFKELTRAAVHALGAEGVSLIFNTPNQFSLPGYLQLGWSVVEECALLFKDRPAEIPKPDARGLGSLWSECFNDEILSWREFYSVYGSTLRPQLAAWENDRGRQGLRTPREVEYLSWRYGAHPFVTYGVHSLTDDHGLSGFLVLRPNRRRGASEVVVAEMLLRRADPLLAKELLKSALRRLRADYVACCFAEGSLEREAAVALGFRSRPGQFVRIAARSLGAELRQWSSDFSLGDLEIF